MRLVRYLVDNINKSIIGFFVGVLLAAGINKREAIFQHRQFNVYLSIAQIVALLIFLLIILIFLVWLIGKFKKLKIIKAKYGAPGSYVSIIKILNSFISSNSINHHLNNGIVGGNDPAPHVPKHAIIDYRLGWRTSRIVVNEGQEIVIPKKKHQGILN